MNATSPYTLDEKSLSDIKKPPLRRRLLWLFIIAIVSYAAWRNRDVLIAKPSAVDTPVQPNGPGGREVRSGRGGRGAGGASAVVVVGARKTDMPIYLHGLGSVAPYTSVTVRSRVDGQLVNVAFQEGQLVREGDLLAEIDRRPFEIQLAQAQAQLDQARGNLDRDTALLKGATTEYIRNQELLTKGLIAKQQADMQSATVDQYEGSIQADHAAMETAQAAIANANLQITYSKIVAPISGRIGLRLVDPGNIVRASDSAGLAIIAQLQPITVLFNIPEDNLGAVLKKLRTGQTLKVDAYDRDDQTRLATGILMTVDNQIDAATGTSKLKAGFPNQDNALFPNQFVNVHLLVEVERNATVIPMAAVQRGPDGAYVYVVDAQKRAQMRPVTLKTTEGSDVAVGKELKPGELVIVEGADKVRDGAHVEVQVDDETATDGRSES